MNDRQIRCFLEVSRTGSFTKAADRLFLPQPAVSRYISSLEKELGVTLFIRENNRNFYLSEDGKSFYNIFLRFISELDHKLEEIHSDLQPLHMGFNSGWNLSAFLPQVVENCRKRNPQFAITVDCLDFTTLLRALVSGRLDVILTLEDYCQTTPEIQVERITQIRRYLVYSKSSYPQVSDPADFYEEDFFLIDDPKIRMLAEQIESYCAPYHFIPKLKTVSNIETVIAGIENGLGAAFLDEWAQGIHDPGVGHFDLGTTHNVCLAWKSGAYSAELRLFAEELKSYLNTRASI